MSSQTKISAENLLNKVNAFPVMPRAVADIVRSIDDDRLFLGDLERKIESDMGMLTGVLKLVNSARYNIPGGVATTRQAILVLGSNAIRSLACIGGVTSFFEQQSKTDFDIKNFMLHNIGVACCAKHVARLCGVNQDIAFIAGLLHDVGIFFEMTALPAEFLVVTDYKRTSDCESLEAEQVILGVNHATIGSLLAKSWNFPESICEAIANHHHITAESASSINCVVHIADVLAHGLDLGGRGDQVPQLSSFALDYLSLDLRKVSHLFNEIENEFDEYIYTLGFSDASCNKNHDTGLRT